MNIRKARQSELSVIENIYSEGRAFMRERGNMRQWQGGYPSREVILEDIEQGRLYAVEEEGELLGVFCFFLGVDETYLKIYGGEWLEPERDYGVLHRIAVSKRARGRGVGRLCFDFCFEGCGNLRVDTHRDNAPMRHALERNGFSERGIIYLKSGDERIAYQKI